MEMTSYEPGTPSWIDIGSPNPAAAAAFYGSLFGWKCEDSGPEGAGYLIAMLNGKSVAGIGQQQNTDVPPYWTTYVSVSDVETTSKAVKEAGGQVLVESMDVMSAGRLAVYADPTGAPFSVWQPLDHPGAQLVNETGTFVWNELNTRQPEEAKAFYSSVFSWEPSTQPMGDTMYTEWKLNGRSIGGMFPMDDSIPANVPSFWMVYFVVDDADAAVAKIEELGGSVKMPAKDIPVGRFAVVADPDGAVFSVIKPNPIENS